MRLTLRTLLSYLDNVLDPPARAELQRQIEASEHASEWVHRTRDVTRRLKLGAPEPGGSGSIDDPNTVAEYLDRTLPEEGVAEFERVCLESDAMLAEVASCHHVLAMFLSEPAEIDPDTRGRLHRLETDLAAALKARAENTPRSVSAEPAAPAAETVEPQPARRVRTRRRRSAEAEESGGFWSDFVPWIPAVAALVLLSLTAFLVLNNEPTPVAKTQTENQDADTEDSNTEDTGATTTGDSADEETGDDQAGDDETAGQATRNGDDLEELEASGGVASTPEPSDSATVEPSGEDAPAGPDPVTEPAVNKGAETTAAPGGSTEVPAEPTSNTPPPTPTDPSAANASAESDAMDAAPAPADPDAAESDTAGSDMAGEDAEPPAVLTFYGDPPPPDAPQTGPLSRLDPDGFVVVEAEGGAWRRLLNGMFMEAPQKGHVISMPAYRGAFELSQGVLVELVDQTEAVIDPEQPGVELRYGRVVMSGSPNAEEPVEIAVRIDSIDYTLELSPGASVAIAADRFYDPGRPMLEDAAPMVAIAHTLSGDATWKTPTSERTSARPAPLFYVSGSLSGAPEGFRDPEWVTSVAVSDADLESSPYVAGQVEGVVLPQLLAMADPTTSRETRDVVSLAGRCAAALMQPDALVASFEDKAQADEWQRHLDALRQVASRSTRGAEVVRQAFVEKYGATGGGALFEVVQGFTPDQVGDDAASVQAGVVPGKLLPMLDSEDLATRVLGSLALFELIDHRQAAKDIAVADRRDRRTFLRRLERDIRDGELALLPR